MVYLFLRHAPVDHIQFNHIDMACLDLEYGTSNRFKIPEQTNKHSSRLFSSRVRVCAICVYLQVLFLGYHCNITSQKEP